MNTYKVIGLMSGTSLDGVDIAFCVFRKKEKKWSFEIKAAETIDYSKDWIKKLSTVEKSNAFTLAQTNVEYGHYLGQLVKNFIIKNKIFPDFISSHGHTIFHQPEKKITLQIGDGAAIAAVAGLPVVCDFRSTDVALGGQGAPLVPIGDKYLFSEYDLCLNLGGFSNISFDKRKERIAFDICPANIILNKLAEESGTSFDNKGLLARSGNFNKVLFDELNSLLYYSLYPPKSLRKEWMINSFHPIINKYKIPVNDKLNTVCEHIVFQIGQATYFKQSKKMLVTGGGAFNDYLIERIKEHAHHEIFIPSKKIILFKEALIFAFLGVLRMEEKPNCLKSVTGAIKDNIGGAIYLH